MKALIAKLRRGICGLCSDCEGNVAIIFAFSLFPIIGLTGAAIDYSRAGAIKADMQSALDATALMVSKTAATSTSSQLQAAAVAYFQSLFTSPVATTPVITVAYTTAGGSSVTVSGATSYKTNFVEILGVKTLGISSSSTVNWGSSRLRVALALDNTGSMADNGKITALKTATLSLLTQLKSAAINNGDVYVSIVPFEKDVNLGAANYSSVWIDWADWNAANGSCSKDTSWKTYNPKSACASAGGSWTADNHNTWNGCVTDRGNTNAPNSANYDTNVVAPTTSITATLLPAEQDPYCPQPVMALSYNWTGMTTLVNNMSPNGNTNQAIGLALGWMSLTGGGAFGTAPAMDPNYTYSQVIILLTDGLNTQDRWYTSQTSIDAREQLTCNNAKAAGITIYAIQVNTSGDPTSALLQTCASDAKKFFLLTSASQIVTTFNQIGTNLSNLRIAK
jgi:Flp pilus assembly protein TadG